MNESYEEIPPRADAMVTSLRAMGYDLPMAFADLIDNSISAKSQHICIDYKWEGNDSWIRILDDGFGMTEEQLKEAMRLGSQSPNEDRKPDDLGRFGLGLKTASFSQCRMLIVQTKTPEGEVSRRFWDLDHVEKTNKWEIGTTVTDDVKKLLSPLDKMEHGTVVLWQKLDRITGDFDTEKDEEMRDAFYDKFLSWVKPELEMIFHRYLSPPIKLSIRVGRDTLKPWDPYLTSNFFTQRLPKEKYEKGSVELIPYVLPHVSKRTQQENSAGAGPKGWNAQQGFYLYRNKRLIVPGGYLDFQLKPEEHYKLARIRMDINNEMDHEWKIDIRKAAASPPDRLRPELEKVARATRAEAVKIYKARTGAPRNYSRKNTDEVWVKKRIGEKIVYKINRENEVISSLLEENNSSRSWANKIFHTIETTVPYRLIIMDNSEIEDCHVDQPLEINNPSTEMIMLCRNFYQRKREEGKNHEEAIDVIMSLEPFNTHPAYRASLEEMGEVNE
ncbi:ATP-binding protein [Methanolobus sp. WCC5]|uniref:ATP-binding protein n=1 Tax=Methanolobus sp. WCC5 TaxID=3125785 RepID=UPI00325382D1